MNSSEEETSDGVETEEEESEDEETSEEHDSAGGKDHEHPHGLEDVSTPPAKSGAPSEARNKSVKVKTLATGVYDPATDTWSKEQKE